MAAKPGLGTLGEFPRLRLCRLPTPLEAMPNLGEALGGAGVYVKRDDCTDLAFGGNKVRQLEFYLGEARLQGADTILITGAVQSNFVRLAAAAASKSGMDCHIQLEERVPRDDSALSKLREMCCWTGSWGRRCIPIPRAKMRRGRTGVWRRSPRN